MVVEGNLHLVVLERGALLAAIEEGSEALIFVESVDHLVQSGCGAGSLFGRIVEQVVGQYSAHVDGVLASIYLAGESQSRIRACHHQVDIGIAVTVHARVCGILGAVLTHDLSQRSASFRRNQVFSSGL